MSETEHEEAFAARLIANGQGSYPLREHAKYDEAVVAFPLETLDEVRVFLRRQGQTKREFCFLITPTGASSPSIEDAEIAPRDVRLAVAERFLCDTLEILRDLPGALQHQLLQRGLDHLAKSGQLRDNETKLLRAFVDAWPGRGKRVDKGTGKR